LHRRRALHCGKSGCLGDGADGKARLKGGAQSGEKFELEIDESELDKNLAAARACPVNVIHVINLDTGEQLI